ncbi:hypothetical protein CHS0354_006456 [Potamilus streckersoni]|uniref:G-protein coupled receptors family 2 profile 2 domain-containing protein n=1 Tax=Potamilus streckersoni TaxID=2493646 RepID=A0AAE0TAA4_9BIVA|nr:hypothetical protein CHS0354_006456 [Potamilus streckersoni]
MYRVLKNGVKHQNNNNNNNSSCWLSIKRSTIWAFVGPAIAVIIVNIVILILVIRIVISSAKLDSRGEYDHIKAGIKGALFLLPLLGLTWIFGLLCVNKELMVFQYLFASFNSLQGFFIFLFHCALNSEVRQALKRMRDRHLLQRGDVITNSTTSSAPDYYGSSSHPEAVDSRYNSKYVDAFKIYRILHVSTRDKSLPKPSKSERTDSQNSGRTRDTVLSRHGQSPDMLFPNDQLALIYI